MLRKGALAKVEFGLLMHSAAMSTVASLVLIHTTWTAPKPRPKAKPARIIQTSEDHVHHVPILNKMYAVTMEFRNLSRVVPIHALVHGPHVLVSSSRLLHNHNAPRHDTLGTVTD